MDAKSKMDTVETSDSGFAPSTIPGGCDDAQYGVSVRNMPAQKPGYEWYVFRASYGRAEKAVEHLAQLHAYHYVAFHTVYVMRQGKRKRVIAPLIPGIVFAYLTESEAALFTKGPLGMTDKSDDTFSDRSKEDRSAVIQLSKIISYYYNHFETDPETGLNPPLTIPYTVMNTFVTATDSKKDVQPLKKGAFIAGDEVVVTEGEFAGLRGRVLSDYRVGKLLHVQLDGYDSPDADKARDRRDDRRRLCFQLPCLGSFSSAYIPAAFFRKAE